MWEELLFTSFTATDAQRTVLRKGHSQKQRFRKILTALSRDKLVLISTHIVSDVEFIANHIIMIRDRRIYCNDTVEVICGKLTGQVFETVIPVGQLPRWEEQYQVVSQRFLWGYLW